MAAWKYPRSWSNLPGGRQPARRPDRSARIAAAAVLLSFGTPVAGALEVFSISAFRAALWSENHLAPTFRYPLSTTPTSWASSPARSLPLKVLLRCFQPHTFGSAPPRSKLSSRPATGVPDYRTPRAAGYRVRSIMFRRSGLGGRRR